MKYPFTVKHNGKYYPAGADVPVGETAPRATEDPKKEDVKAEVKKETPKPIPKQNKKK